MRGLPAIISASRRTDIPAFFGEWFRRRVEEGFADRVNPFNAKQVKRISLLPEDVRCIVFWSKNPKPMLGHLPLLETKGLPYVFHYTLNDYPDWLEPGVPSVDSRIDTFRRIADRIGPERIAWRYDPILVSSATPMDFHLERMERIAVRLEGSTSRLVFSLFDDYAKLNPLKVYMDNQGIAVNDPTAPEHGELLSGLARGIRTIADRHGLEPETCAEKVELAEFGIPHGACIDGEWIGKLFGGASERKDPYQREECGCVASIDIGMYDTCRFGCTYCYAVRSPKAVETNLKRHDPKGAALLIRD